jgi:hypothetical protein
MRKTIFTVLAVPLMAALTVPSAGAAERHRVRTKTRAAVSRQYRDANAYAATGYGAEPQSYLSSLDEGAMSSGPAGH